MAHSGIFTTSDEILTKAGENVSSNASTEARINKLCLQAESFINVITRTNFSDSYDDLDSDVKGILSEAESNLVAIYLISYDMSGYSTRVEAEDMLNILKVRFNECIKILSDNTAVKFINGA